MTSQPSRIQTILAIVGGVVVLAAVVASIIPLIRSEPGNNPTERVIGATSNAQITITPALGDGLDEGDLEEELVEIEALLAAAYALKAQSLREVSVDNLDDLYLGPALVKRVEIVEQVADGCYWEVSLLEPETIYIQSIDTRLAEIVTLRTERRIHICDGEEQSATSVESDQYRVFYNLTRQDGRWRIVDVKVTDIRE